MSRNSVKRARKGKKGPGVPHQNAATANDIYELRKNKQKIRKEKKAKKALEEKMAFMKALGYKFPEDQDEDSLSLTESTEITEETSETEDTD